MESQRIAGYTVGAGERKVIVVHEIFGLNAHVRQIAERLATAGFAVHAVDLFDGTTTDVLAEGFALSHALDWPRAIDAIGRTAEALRTRSESRIGIVGFCMGGALALAAAAQVSALDACVSFYGIPGDDKADLSSVRASVLGHFGTRDPYITNDRVNALEATLLRAGVAATIHRYDAGHGFVREEPGGAAAQLAWQRTVAWLRNELTA